MMALLSHSSQSIYKIKINEKSVGIVIVSFNHLVVSMNHYLKFMKNEFGSCLNKIGNRIAAAICIQKLSTFYNPPSSLVVR